MGRFEHEEQSDLCRVGRQEVGYVPRACRTVLKVTLRGQGHDKRLRARAVAHPPFDADDETLAMRWATATERVGVLR